MKTIASIELANFQSHARTIIEPAGAGELTCIVGITDSGKSAFFRAMRWVLFGGPVSPRNGCRHTSTSITFVDGSIVTREKVGSTNRYVVAKPGEDPQVYEGFRNQIPLEVQQALGIKAIDVSGITIETNLARQLESAFLGSAVSSPARAKVLGHIAGIEAVDMAVRSAGRDLLDGQIEKKRVDREVNDLRDEVAKYDHLPKLAEKIEQLEALQSKIIDLQERRKRISWYAARLKDLRSQAVPHRATLARTATAANALRLLIRATEDLERRTRLQSASSAIIDLNQRSAASKKVILLTSSHQVVIDLISKAESAYLVHSRMIRARLTIDRLAGMKSALTPTIWRTAGGELAVSVIQRALTTQGRRSALIGLRSTLRQLNRQSANAQVRLDKSSAEMAAGKVIDLAEAALSRRDRFSGIKSTLGSIRQLEQKAIGTKELATSDLERARFLYTQSLKEVGRCPVCGSDTSEPHRHLQEVV